MRILVAAAILVLPAIVAGDASTKTCPEFKTQSVKVSVVNVVSSLFRLEWKECSGASNYQLSVTGISPLKTKALSWVGNIPNAPGRYFASLAALDSSGDVIQSVEFPIAVPAPPAVDLSPKDTVVYASEPDFSFKSRGAHSVKATLIDPRGARKILQVSLPGAGQVDDWILGRAKLHSKDALYLAGNYTWKLESYGSEGELLNKSSAKFSYQPILIRLAKATLSPHIKRPNSLDRYSRGHSNARREQVFYKAVVYDRAHYLLQSIHITGADGSKLNKTRLPGVELELRHVRDGEKQRCPNIELQQRICKDPIANQLDAKEGIEFLLSNSGVLRYYVVAYERVGEGENSVRKLATISEVTGLETQVGPNLLGTRLKVSFGGGLSLAVFGEMSFAILMKKKLRFGVFARSGLSFPDYSETFVKLDVGGMVSFVLYDFLKQAFPDGESRRLIVSSLQFGVDSNLAVGMGSAALSGSLRISFAPTALLRAFFGFGIRGILVTQQIPNPQKRVQPFIQLGITLY